MALPTKHIRHQLPVIASLGGTIIAALRQQAAAKKGIVAPTPVTPSADIKKTIPPRPADLVADYLRNVGGDPSAYRGEVPAHMFPQWGFPLAAKTLEGIPYPMARVLNGGCRLEINGRLPLGEALDVTARLEDIDDNGKRAVLHQKVITGTKANPEAVVAHLYAIVPLGGGKDGQKPAEAKGAPPPPKSKKPDAVRVPADATELAYWKLRPDAGLSFAMLTGDFNPVHWITPYAKAFGFKSTILHGFATMARAIEGLNRGLFSGDAHRIATFDCKFTKPLVLPSSVGLYVSGNQVFVGDAPGSSAYLAGSFTTVRE